jgi:hypothetical protein
VIDKTSVFANQKIRIFRGQISNDEKQITVINQALASSSLSSTDKLVLEIRLGTLNDSELSTTQLLSQATQVEAPHVLTNAVPNRITARSHRNTAVVAALIGAIIGALVALLWDGIAASLQRRRST